MNAYLDEDDDGFGPPSLEDDAWYTHFVVSLGYPKLKRGPKPMKGQASLLDAPSLQARRTGGSSPGV